MFILSLIDQIFQLAYHVQLESRYETDHGLCHLNYLCIIERGGTFYCKPNAGLDHTTFYHHKYHTEIFFYLWLILYYTYLQWFPFYCGTHNRKNDFSLFNYGNLLPGEDFETDIPGSILHISKILVYFMIQYWFVS